MIPGTDRKDEIGDMAEAVQVFKTNMIEADRLRARAGGGRAKRDHRKALGRGTRSRAQEGG